MCDYENEKAGVKPATLGEDSSSENLMGSKQDNEKDRPQLSQKNIISSQQGSRAEQLSRKFRCFDPSDAVDIAIEECNGHVIKPMTIPQLFQSICAKLPGGVALCWKEGRENQWQRSTYSQYKELIYNVAKSFLKSICDKLPDGVALCWKEGKVDQWQKLTYSQYRELIYNVAKSFLKLGLEPFHSVCILGFNSVEWFASSLGAVFAGGLSTGIYTTNSPEACYYILEDSKANIAVVEDQTQLNKILEVRDRLPHLKAIIQYKGELSKDYPDTYTWDKFLETGKDMEDSVIDNIITKQLPSHCAALVYTSGTTGNPKGVMLSHDNIVWAAAANTNALIGDKWKYGVDRFISYLPLSHSAGKLTGIYFPVYVGGTVYFAQPDALKGTLGVTLKEVQPTFFFGVPRVYEKMKEKMEEVGRTITGFKAMVSRWAREIGLRGNQNIQKGLSVPWGWTVADMLVFKKVKEALGLKDCRISLVGGAPTQRQTLEFFMALNIPILEMYGMSECGGAVTVNLKNAATWRTGSCGKVISGVELKIDNPDECGNGEILVRGRNVFMGYLGLEEKTRETIDDEGWLHSGDIGRLDKEGFLYITGRIKELIITSGGENIPPTYIEECIKTEVPFLSNVMVVGDKRKYLTCLITLKCVIDLDTQEATDNLQPQVIKMFQQLGCNCTTVSQVIESEDNAVFKAIQDGIDRYNARQSISNAQKVQKWKLLNTDFTIPGGELGPTLKIKRPVVVQKYAETIESFYSDI